MRDKFLTEAMGECWHEFPPHGAIKVINETDFIIYCLKGCEVVASQAKPYNHPDFSTWEGFGRLWTFAQKQEWWLAFQVFANNLCGYEMTLTFAKQIGCSMPNELINPERFADAVYKYLKEQE